MKFLNNKEETIDFQLTPYGRYLLSKGEFKPEFYDFFDSEIIYDSQYGNVSETQNSIETRIKETPQLEVQSAYAGVETNIKKIVKSIRDEQLNKDIKFEKLRNDTFQPNVDKNYSLFAPIGTVNSDSDYAPAFSIRLLHGQISGSVNHIAGLFPLDKIPQIELEPVEYKIIEQQGEIDLNLNQNIETSEVFRDSGLLSAPMRDGSFVELQEDYRLFSIDEFNSSNKNENFEIEVYEIQSAPRQIGSGSCEEVLIPLYFKKQKPEIVDGILVEQDNLEEDFELDSSFVEYFFDLRVDTEIPEEVFCKLPKEKRPDFADCSDVIEAENIYRTDVTEKEIC